jgi:hypothetical protein
MSPEQVDLVVVRDRKLATRIVKALRHAGVGCSEFWPEDVVMDSSGLPRPALGVPTSTVVAGAVGPFHIRVVEADLGKARDVLLTAGLTAQLQSDAAALDESLREVTRTGVQMHAMALRRVFVDRHIAVQIWPASSHRVLGMLETHDAPYRIMVPSEQFAEAQALLGKADGYLAIDESRPKS